MNAPFSSPKCLVNRPFQSFFVPLFHSKSNCENILIKMTLICMKMELHAELIFIWKVSKQRHKRTRKRRVISKFFKRSWRCLKILRRRSERFDSSHRSLGVYLSTLSYSVGKRFLIKLSAVGMKCGSKRYLWKFTVRVFFFGAEEALELLVITIFPL